MLENIKLVALMNYRRRRLLYLISGWDLNEGLAKNREMTDKFFFFIFTLAFVVLMILSIIFLMNGVPYPLTQGLDSFGNVCGVKNAKVFDHPLSGLNNYGKNYLMTLLPNKRKEARIVLCANTCIRSQTNTERDVFNAIGHNTNSPVICHLSRKIREKHLQQNLEQNASCIDLPKYREVVLWNRCFPSYKLTLVQCSDQMLQTYLDVFYAVAMTHIIIYAGVVFAILMVWVAAKLPEVFMYLIIIVTLNIFLTTVIVFLNNYYSELGRNSIVLVTIFAFFALTLLLHYFWHIINFDHGSKVLMKYTSQWLLKKSLIFVAPVLLVLVQTMFIGLFFTVHLHRISNYVLKVTPYNTIIPFLHPYTKSFSWYFMGVSIWAFEALRHSFHYVMSDMVATKYYQPNINQPVLVFSFARLLSFHFGSVILGTIVMNPFLRVITLVTEDLYWRNQEDCLKSGEKTKTFMFEMHQRFFRYYNKQVYLIIALFGFNMECSSKILCCVYYNSFMIRNNKAVKSIFKLLGCIKLVSFHLVFLISLIVVEQRKQLCSKYAIIIVLNIISYVCLSCFFSLIQQSYESMRICMAIDMNQNFSPGSKNVLVQQEVNEAILKKYVGIYKVAFPEMVDVDFMKHM